MYINTRFFESIRFHRQQSLQDELSSVIERQDRMLLVPEYTLYTLYYWPSRCTHKAPPLVQSEPTDRLWLTNCERHTYGLVLISKTF